MPNSRERRRSPDDRRGGANNQLRVDLYRQLIPQIQTQDQKSGAQGYVIHWNDPDAQWNKADDIRSAWNAVGLSPVIQSLFWVLETLEGEELAVLESMDGLIDPFATPVELLGDISASFGYRLKEDLDEDTKRMVVQGLFHAYKALGQRIGFDVFYRMVGFQIIRVFPLWKKDVFEANNAYNRVRFVTTTIGPEAIGPAGSIAYRTNLSDSPIQPGTLRITDGTDVLKDQPAGFLQDGLAVGVEGTIIGPNGTEFGTINYQSGELEVTFDAVTLGAVTAIYEQITEEFPLHAARFDIEILMNPGGVPIPLVDGEVLRSILDRLDEVRPIHVLLRALTLAFEFEDTVDSFASDQTACTQKLQDSRDPFAGLPGREFLYFLDASPNVRQDDLLIDHASGGTQTKDVILEDRLDGFTCPGVDTLDIDAGAFSQFV